MYSWLYTLSLSLSPSLSPSLLSLPLSLSLSLSLSLCLPSSEKWHTDKRFILHRISVYIDLTLKYCFGKLQLQKNQCRKHTDMLLIKGLGAGLQKAGGGVAQGLLLMPMSIVYIREKDALKDCREGKIFAWMGMINCVENRYFDFYSNIRWLYLIIFFSAIH